MKKQCAANVELLYGLSVEANSFAGGHQAANYSKPSSQSHPNHTWKLVRRPCVTGSGAW